MKIINQTVDEMVLKDGQPILGLFMGIIFMIVGERPKLCNFY